MVPVEVYFFFRGKAFEKSRDIKPALCALWAPAQSGS